MLTPGQAYLLGYLPAARIGLRARRELCELVAAAPEPALRHAVDFARRGLDVEASQVAAEDRRHAEVAAAAGVPVAAIPVEDVAPWLAALAGAVRPHLTSPVLEAAWRAGETARLVQVSAILAGHLAYLRASADHPALRAQAEARARDLRAAVAALGPQLAQTGLPLVASHAGDAARFAALVRDLAPAHADGIRELGQLRRDLAMVFDALALHLDAPPPAAATAPPTAAEDALLARILADPADAMLRLDLAALLDRRGDPRAELIRLQLAEDGPAARARADQLVRAHPAWTAPLRALGARDVRFDAGFPDELTIDADALLGHARALLATAPLTRLHVRAARGRIAELVRAPWLATIEGLDLDHQGVTDADLEALAASPHAARLRRLELRYNPITARGVEALAASPHLRGLEQVFLDGNPADPVDRLEYYDETHQHAVPTEAGRALEARHGRLRWLHPHG